jgi:hypothetical protein
MECKIYCRILWGSYLGPVVKVCGPSVNLKLELLKWIANDLCELITKLFDLVAEEAQG